MRPWDLLEGVTEPEFSISSQGLGHATPNMGYLAKSAKCRVRKPEIDRQSLTGLILNNAAKYPTGRKGKNGSRGHTL